MGQTYIEKIFQLHSRDEVKPGAIIWLDLDVRSARDFAGANVVQNFRREYPGESVADAGRTFFTFDCNAPANTIPYADNQQICRKFASEQGIRVYDVDAGIGSHVLIDQGHCVPGSTVVGTDSHMNILGAVGAFGQGMGDQDIAFAFKTGKTWFEVPASMRIVLRGHPPQATSAKDLVLAVLREIGSRGVLGLAAEFSGEAVDMLDIDGRITLASMVTEMGGIIGLIQPDQQVIEYIRERSSAQFAADLGPDADADYVRTVEIDVSGLQPLIACPPNPSNVKTVSDVAGRPIDSVFIGSCTNGRLADMREVVRLVRGRRVAQGVVAVVVPSTREVFGSMLRDGIIEELYRAGFVISNAGCGGCASGQIGMTGTGQVHISTSNRNFRGKQGNGETYLASPATAAASAILGRIASSIDLEERKVL